MEQHPLAQQAHLVRLVRQHQLDRHRHQLQAHWQLDQYQEQRANHVQKCKQLMSQSARRSLWLRMTYPRAKTSNSKWHQHVVFRSRRMSCASGCCSIRWTSSCGACCSCTARCNTWRRTHTSCVYNIEQTIVPNQKCEKCEKCEKYWPVEGSVQALISRTTPFGDSPSVVRTTVISRRATGWFDGVCVESNEAGFFLSSFGLELVKIDLPLIGFPSGE